MLNLTCLWPSVHACVVRWPGDLTEIALVQAVLPFLDPVTANKVVFVGKGKGEAAIMAEQFHMEDMEACLGGRGAWAFQKEQYRKFCCDVEAQPRPVSTPSS